MARNSAGPPLPAACTPIGNSSVSDVTCTSASDSQAGSEFKCKDGFYLQDNEAPTADTCEPCPGIPNSNNVGIICADGGISKWGLPKSGFACDVGYRMVYDPLKPGAVATCEKCPNILNSNNVGLTCGEQGVW
jgi:hypothetical protein